MNMSFKKSREEEMIEKIYKPPNPKREWYEEMEKIRMTQKEASNWTIVNTLINVFIPPTIICPECMQHYVATLMEDGLRIRFRHSNKKLSCSMATTEFHRPMAAFIKEI